MDFITNLNGVFLAKSDQFFAPIRCAIGRNGMIPAAQKQEGDGASPIGTWPMRRLFYRADRLHQPETALNCVKIAPDMGWCDAPDSPDYNRLIRLPHPARHEKMWREDHVYDLVVELGHNDNPPTPGLGSAIFLHVAKPDYTPTEGCVALSKSDLLAVLKHCRPGSRLEISPQTSVSGAA